MDYKVFVDSFEQIAAVISVDLHDLKDSSAYKIVEANSAYISTVVNDPNDFVCDIPYTKYIRTDKNFERMCAECVTTKLPVHAYVDAEFFNSWMDIYMFPLSGGTEDTGYCLFSYNMTPKADVDKMMDISADTALHVLKTCIRLRETDNFHEAMDSIIADIREECDAIRCCILLTDFNNRTFKVLCEDADEKEVGPSIKEIMGEGFFDIIETWPRLIDGSNCFIIENEEDMKRVDKVAPEWGASLRCAGVKKLVIYPLRSETETIGYIWAGNFDGSRTMKIKEILEVTTFILSAEIANHQMIKRMKIMSSTDLLTGVLNRNAMNNRILDNDAGTIPIKEPYGIFFVDVNGLKTTNDSKGHLAGDNLLKDVAVTLKEHFTEGEVYRVGGDEFMVIIENVEKAEFDRLDESLRSDSERPGRAHYAVGSSFSGETHNIKRSMQLADTRMYENKQSYYERHPECVWDRRFLRRTE